MGVTREQKDVCYYYAKKVLKGTLKISEAKILVEKDTRELESGVMKASSAGYLIGATVAMLRGEGYTGLIAGDSTEYMPELIYKEFGIEQLKLAVQAVIEHIAYKRAKNNAMNQEQEKVIILINKYKLEEFYKFIESNTNKLNLISWEPFL